MPQSCWLLCKYVVSSCFPSIIIEGRFIFQGGYNIATLVELLDDAALGELAAKGLSQTILMFEAFFDVEQKAKNGNKYAKKVLQSWADAEVCLPLHI